MQKTIRNQFDKYLTYEKLLEAHNKSKKGKSRKKDLIKFNLKQEEYVMWLYEQLKNGIYKHGGYTEFYVSEPKRRKIEKSRYIDRIVHRWVVDNFLIPNFQSQFIYTSYACIKNKGMHRSAFYVQNAMRKAKREWGENYYIIKTDVSKYFNSIDKKILIEILQRKIKDKKLMWLINEILYAQKREKGLEIGNYTSQVFANIYLNEVDQYIKHELKMKYYVRYLDDSIIFAQTKQEAKEVLEKVRIIIRKKLKLELNDKTQIFKAKQGVNFCGYKINEYRLKLRNRGKKKLKKKIKKLKTEVKNRKISSHDAKKELAGHIGYIKWADVYNLTSKLFYVEKDFDKSKVKN